MLRLIRSSVFLCRVALTPFLVGAALVLAGCAAPAISHDVTVFHDWPVALQERSFRFAQPAPEADELRWLTWRKVIREELVKAGFTETANPSIEVGFDYQVSAAELRIRRPIHVAPTVHFGHRHRDGGFSVAGPLWWGGFPEYFVDVVQVHDHQLKLLMFDARSGQMRKIYEGSSQSRLRASAATGALVLLVRSVLEDFPGTSGIVRRVLIDPAPAATNKKSPGG